jgi:hypothetical protein
MKTGFFETLSVPTRVQVAHPFSFFRDSSNNSNLSWLLIFCNPFIPFTLIFLRVQYNLHPHNDPILRPCADRPNVSFKAFRRAEDVKSNRGRIVRSRGWPSRSKNVFDRAWHQTADGTLVGVGNANDVTAHRTTDFLSVYIDKLFLDVPDSKKKEKWKNKK